MEARKLAAVLLLCSLVMAAAAGGDDSDQSCFDECKNNECTDKSGFLNFDWSVCELKCYTNCGVETVTGKFAAGD